MIVVDQVSKVYYPSTSRKLTALNEVSMFIPEGQLVVIQGPSGSGKSTLLNIMAGLDQPSNGYVMVGDKTIHELRDVALANYRNSTIGLIFQMFHLIHDLTVLENVELPARIGGTKRGGIVRREAKEILAKLGLDKHLSHFPSELSGGQMQRVAIARSLINGAKILFCDEPTGNLDSQISKEICNYLKDLSRIDKKTIVIVTHDDRITKIADKVFLLKDGMLEE